MYNIYRERDREIMHHHPFDLLLCRDAERKAKQMVRSPNLASELSRTKLLPPTRPLRQRHRNHEQVRALLHARARCRKSVSQAASSWYICWLCEPGT